MRNILYHHSSNNCCGGCGEPNPCEKKVYRGICLSDIKVCVNKYTEYGVTADATLEQLVDALLLEIENATGGNGLSTYELWLSEGNTGSIADFLDSIKGADGQDGNDGANGTKYTISNTQPISPIIGDIWEHTALNVKKQWDGATWVVKDSIQEFRTLFNLSQSGIQLSNIPNGQQLFILNNIS